MSKYRIEYTIQQAEEGSDDWVEIGFGSSGSASNLNDAVYSVTSYVQNNQWETEPGMPDPGSVDIYGR